MKGDAHKGRIICSNCIANVVARQMSSEDVYALLLQEKELINVLN